MIIKNKKNLFLFIISILILFNTSFADSPAKIFISWRQKAKKEGINIKYLAVLDFHSQNPDDGKKAANLLINALIEAGHFKLVEREDIEKAAQELNLQLSGLVDEETAKKVGKFLAVEGIIIGQIPVCGVEKEEGTEQVKTKVGTGEYEEVEEKEYVFFGPKVKRKREKTKDVFIPKKFVVKRATVSINFRLIDVETANILAAGDEKESFTQKGIGAEEISRLFSDEEILDNLLKIEINSLMKEISPHNVEEIRYLEKGRKKDNLVKDGVKFAEAGFWDSAINKWEEALKINPDNDAANGNLGAVFEIKGMFEKAKEFYQRAYYLRTGRQTYEHNLTSLKNRLVSEEKKEIITGGTETKENIIIETEENFVYIDAGKNQDVKEGDVFLVYEERIIKHPVTKEVMGSEEIKIGEIKIIKVYPKMSKAKIIKFFSNKKIKIKNKIKKEEENVK